MNGVSIKTSSKVRHFIIMKQLVIKLSLKFRSYSKYVFCWFRFYIRLMIYKNVFSYTLRGVWTILPPFSPSHNFSKRLNVKPRYFQNEFFFVIFVIENNICFFFSMKWLSFVLKTAVRAYIFINGKSKIIKSRKRMYWELSLDI